MPFFGLFRLLSVLSLFWVRAGSIAVCACQNGAHALCVRGVKGCTEVVLRWWPVMKELKFTEGNRRRLCGGCIGLLVFEQSVRVKADHFLTEPVIDALHGFHYRQHFVDGENARGLLNIT